jgi:cysteine synthase A
VISQKLAGEPIKPGRHTIQGIGAGFIPDILNLDIIDEVIKVDDEDAMETARQMAKREGLMCGISCGATCRAPQAAAGKRRQDDRRGAPRPRRAVSLDAALPGVSGRFAISDAG